MNCDNCTERRAQAEPVSYIAFESMKATMERTIKRLWIVVLVLILLLAGTNAAWIYYESQLEVVETTETYEASTDGGGTAIANGSGTVEYGEG